MAVNPTSVLPLSPIVQKYLAPQPPSGKTTFVQITRPLENGPVKILAPDGREIRMVPKPAPVELPESTNDIPITKNLETLALAFHWCRLLDSGRFINADEIAQQEGVSPTKVRKVLRLTVLAPLILKQFISHPEMSLDTLKREAIPLDWRRQIAIFQDRTGESMTEQTVSWKKVAQHARTA